MSGAYLAARVFHIVLGLVLVVAYIDFASTPIELPRRFHEPGRVAGLSAYWGLEGAGPGTVGRL